VRIGKRALALVLPGLLAATIATVKFAGGTPLHEDEPAWVGSAYYFDLLMRGELRHTDWRLLPARESPPVGKYLFGAVLWLSGRPIRSIEPLASHYEYWRRVPGAWGTGTDFDDRRAVADRLSPDVRAAIGRGTYQPIDAQQLLAARLLAAAFGIIGAVALSSVGSACRGSITGLIAGMIFAVHPAVVEAYTHALFDIIALAFSVLAVRSLIALLSPVWSEPARWRRSLALGVVTGLLFALAVGAKMNALAVMVLALLLLMLLVGRAWRRRAGDVGVLAVVLTLAMVVSLVLFAAINPAYYPDVLGGFRDSFVVPAQTTKVQAAFLPTFLATPSAKWAALGRLVCGHSMGLWVLAALTLGPTWLGLRRLTARTVVVLWWWLALVIVAAWIPFAWSRYALPVIAPAVVLVPDALIGLVASTAAEVGRHHRTHDRLRPDVAPPPSP
jgi:Dolichyl-phosphate-mannose-protein mannosyltransferase